MSGDVRGKHPPTCMNGDDGSGTRVSRWKCLECGEEFDWEWGKRPPACPSPSCPKPKGGPPRLQALTGPWVYFEDGRFVPERLAAELMAEERFITHRDSHVIYVYRGGVYRPWGEEAIRGACREKLGELARKGHVDEVVEAVRERTFRDPELFNSPPPNLVCVENGILDILTGELRPHDPDTIFLAKVPVRYDPQARCPRILKFLEEVCPDPQDALVLLEFGGYCLYRRYDFQQALMLVGEGETGKSTWLGVLRELLGRENVSGLSLQRLTRSRFAPAELFGRLANIFPDLPSEGVEDTGMFKALTGGDYITAERKFRHPFSFVNQAKLLFSANQIPPTKDLSDAYFRRWVIISFNQVIPPERRDPRLLEKLTEPEELSGLLNLLLGAFRRALRRGCLGYARSTEEVRQEYLRRSDPEAFFVQSCLATDSGWGVSKAVLYKMFQEFCREWKLVPVSDETFHRKLPGLMGGLSEIRPRFPPRQLGEKGRRERVWAGIKPREEAVEGVEVDTTDEGLKVVLNYSKITFLPAPPSGPGGPSGLGSSAKPTLGEALEKILSEEGDAPPAGPSGSETPSRETGQIPPKAASGPGGPSGPGSPLSKLAGETPPEEEGGSVGKLRQGENLDHPDHLDQKNLSESTRGDIQNVREGDTEKPRVEYTEVLLLGDVPYVVVGEDGKNYGPFRRGERVRVPKGLAGVLVSRGVATEVG